MDRLSKWGGRASLLPMRILAFALILAIFVSGSVSVAHAFAPNSQGKAQISDTLPCDDCQSEASKDSNAKEKANNCISCDHCCAGYAAIPVAAASGPLLVSEKLSSVYIDNLTSDYAFSFLRPPQYPA